MNIPIETELKIEWEVQFYADFTWYPDGGPFTSLEKAEEYLEVYGEEAIFPYRLVKKDIIQHTLMAWA